MKEKKIIEKSSGPIPDPLVVASASFVFFCWEKEIAQITFG